MKNLSILFIEKNLSFTDLIRKLIKKEGWLALITSNSSEVVDIINTHMPDIVVMNISELEMDCLQLCRDIRESSNVPILVISPQDNSKEKVKYLDIGADEYLIHPLIPNELIAQIKAVVRRTKTIDIIRDKSDIYCGELKIDFDNRRVQVGTRKVQITPIEYDLLRELALNVGKICTHRFLLEKIWGVEYRDERTYLHTYIKRLRAKLEPDLKNPQYIITVPGIGYYLENRM